MISQHHFTGAEAEACFQKVCCEKAWICCVPIIRDLKYDFVFSQDEGLIWGRCQVKSSTTQRLGKFRFTIRRNGGVAYCLDDFDFLFLCCPAGSWLIPWEEVSGLKQITLPMKTLESYMVSEARLMG